MLLHTGAIKRCALCILLLSLSVLCSVTSGCFSHLTDGSLSCCQCCKKENAKQRRNQQGREYFLVVSRNTFIIYNSPPPPLAPVFSLSVRNGPVRLMSTTLTWFTMTFFFLLARVLFCARLLTLKKNKTKKNRNIKKASDIQGESLWLNVWDENTNKERLAGDTDISSLLNKRTNSHAEAKAPMALALFYLFLAIIVHHLWLWRNKETGGTRNALSLNNTK